MMIIPEDMEVPLFRRNTNEVGNVQWLVRNLAVKNQNHPNFDEVLRTLKLILRGIPKRF
jgi:hypothetical protein